MVKGILISVLILGVLFLLYKRHINTIRVENLELALSLYKKGELSNSKEVISEYLKRFPNDADAWQFLGVMFLDESKDLLAEESFTRAIELDPNNVKALTGLGVIKRNQHKYKKAEKLYKQAIEIDSLNAKTYSSLLIIELLKGDFNKAVELGEKALTIDQGDDQIKGNLSVAYHYAKDFESRDKLIAEMQNSNYRGLSAINLVISGLVPLESIMKK